MTKAPSPAPAPRSSEAARTIFAHDVDQIDIAYLCPGGIAGKSYHVDVAATGPLDHNGFVIDFGVLKKQIKAHLKATADHALVLPARAPGYQLEQVAETGAGDHQNSADQLWLSFASQRGHYGYSCPVDAIYPIEGEALDEQQLTKQILADLAPELPEGLRIEMSLREKQLSPGGVAFTYTHGISRHDGLCQRLFHGHTGELQLRGAADQATTAAIAKTLRDTCFGGGLHIASKDQVVSAKSHPLAKNGPWTADDHYFLHYEGSLGRYSAVVPKHRTLLLPTTASIEHLADYVFEQLHIHHKHQLTSDLELRIWEGLGKGAAISCQGHEPAQD